MKSAPKQPLGRTMAVYLGWFMALIGAALFAYAVLALVGILGSRTGTDLGSLAVAGATLLLASFTLELALSTRSAVEQAQSDLAVERQTLTEVQAQTTELKRQATATEAALASSWRPILVDVSKGTASRNMGGNVLQADAASVIAYNDGTAKVIELSLVNIGSGPAFIESAILEVGAVRSPLARSSTLVITQGDVMHLQFRFDLIREVEKRAVEQAINNNQLILLMVRYKDLGGKVWRSHARVSTAEGDNRVKGVELFEGESLQAFARTGA